MATAARRITDSPWFWAYVFGAGAIVALLLAWSKYGRRQEQIERQFEAREQVTVLGRLEAIEHVVAERAAGKRTGEEPPPARRAHGQRRLIPLEPLFLVLAAVTMLAWAVFWRTHRRASQRESSSSGTPTT